MHNTTGTTNSITRNQQKTQDAAKSFICGLFNTPADRIPHYIDGLCEHDLTAQFWPLVQIIHTEAINLIDAGEGDKLVNPTVVMNQLPEVPTQLRSDLINATTTNPPAAYHLGSLARQLKQLRTRRAINTQGEELKAASHADPATIREQRGRLLYLIRLIDSNFPEEHPLTAYGAA